MLPDTLPMPRMLFWFGTTTWAQDPAVMEAASPFRVPPEVDGDAPHTGDGVLTPATLICGGGQGCVAARASGAMRPPASVLDEARRKFLRFMCGWKAEWLREGRCVSLDRDGADA